MNKGYDKKIAMVEFRLFQNVLSECTHQGWRAEGKKSKVTIIKVNI